MIARACLSLVFWLLAATVAVAQPTVTIAPNRCTVTLAAAPPDSTGGWRVQFLRDGDISVGNADSTPPFERTVANIEAGDHRFYARWTKSGAATETTPAIATTACTLEAPPPPACTYALDYTEWDYPADGTWRHITTVSTQPGCAWAASSDATWLTIDSGQSGAGTGVVTGLVLPNLGPARVGRLTIGGQVFTARQAGAVTPEPCTFGPWVLQSATACVGGRRAETWTQPVLAGTCTPPTEIRPDQPCTGPVEVESAPSNEIAHTAKASAPLALEWDEPTSGAPTGYRLYRGTTPGVYGVPIDVGLARSRTVGVDPGDHVFVVTAYTISGGAVVAAAPRALRAETAPPATHPDSIASQVARLRDELADKFMRLYEQYTVEIPAFDGKLCTPSGVCVPLADIRRAFPVLK